MCPQLYFFCYGIFQYHKYVVRKANTNIKENAKYLWDGKMPILVAKMEYRKCLRWLMEANQWEYCTSWKIQWKMSKNCWPLKINYFHISFNHWRTLMKDCCEKKSIDKTWGSICRQKAENCSLNLFYVLRSMQIWARMYSISQIRQMIKIFLKSCQPRVSSDSISIFVAGKVSKII